MKSACVGALLMGALSVVTQIPSQAAPQDRALTIDAIYDPSTRADFSGAPPGDLPWLDEGHYLRLRRAVSREGREWVKVEAASGNETPLFDVARMEAALAALPGMPREDAVAAARSGDITFNPTRTAGLLSIGDELYF